MPYFRIFDGEKGAREAEIALAKTVIGRNTAMAGILLEHPSVSRIHAVILADRRGFTVQDANSRAGTFLNGARVKNEAKLTHGDTLQIGACVLEFRATDKSKKEQAGASNAMSRAMRVAFRHLPAAVRVRYRTLSVKPNEVFAPGDTILVGTGGILLPDPEPLDVGQCIELEITSPSGKANTFPGEILAILKDDIPHEMCIKLHGLDEIEYGQVLEKSERGPWVTAQEGSVPGVSNA